MMIIRTIKQDDAEAFYRMMCLLDEETNFMMYEPGEREMRGQNPERLNACIAAAASGQDFMQIAVNDDSEIVGFLHAERGKLNRILHTAYIVVGIRQSYRHQGIGAEFFRRLEEWAKSGGLVRLELTVECANTDALKLYEKQGFLIEGIRSKSMKVNEKFVDEYYMAKILNPE